MHDLLEIYRHPNGKPITKNGSVSNGLLNGGAIKANGGGSTIVPNGSASSSTSNQFNNESHFAATSLRYAGRSDGKQAVFQAINSIILDRTKQIKPVGGGGGDQDAGPADAFQSDSEQLEPRDITSALRRKFTDPDP